MTEDQFIKISREFLYSDIWDISASGVAKKYNVPYADLLRLCKEAEIPIPPSGYWTKLSFGKPVIKIPLPKSSLKEVILPTNIISRQSKRYVAYQSSKKMKAENQQIETDDIKVKHTEQTPITATKRVTEKIGSIIFGEVKESNALPHPLAFLTESERGKILLAAQQIEIPTENMKLHRKIIAYKSVIKEWNKKDTKAEGAQRNFNNFSNKPPFLVGVISSETLPRAFRILDTLFHQIEYLGGSVNDNLSFNIRNENVHIVVIESQDEIKHKMTREEAKQLLLYEDAKRHSRWASEPKIRKYDYVFNGHLRITIRKSRYFRDTDSVYIESRLGEMLIELYEESEVVRIDREAREEGQRKREEEERLREERRIHYNAEVERTIGLVNTAQDYDVACKIRAYISALQPHENIDDKTAEMIDWAKKKADWFDPTVARIDEFLGKREYDKNEEEKAVRKSGCYRW